MQERISVLYIGRCPAITVGNDMREIEDNMKGGY